jgi:hypothetical protein
MPNQQMTKVECRKCLAEAYLDNAIKNGIKQFHKDQFRQMMEKPLEIKFFGRPL